jgi:hypothetical protein
MLSPATALNFSNSTTSFTAQPTASQALATLTLKPRLRRVFITFSAERETGGSILGLGDQSSAAHAHWTLGATATFQVSGNASFTTETDSAGGAGATIALSKSALMGPGFGYEVQGTGGAARSAAGQVD